MLYKIIRFIPYLVLLFLAWVCLLIRTYTSSEVLKGILINLTASSIFVVLAYFFYDSIKSYINKRESKYIDSYIRQQISHDVFVVLYTLKKYLHGYNLETNTLQNIFSIIHYTKDQIRALTANQSYLGFQIFKEMEDLKDIFKGALDNSFVINNSPREYLINLVKIIDLLAKLEHIYRYEDNYVQSPEKAIEFSCVNAKDINSNNEEGRYLLLKKTQIQNRFVVYDSGRFDQTAEHKLLNRYTMKEKYINMVTNEIFNLIKHLDFWLPKEFPISKYDNRYRIIKNFFSAFAKASTMTKRIYVADIVER